MKSISVSKAKYLDKFKIQILFSDLTTRIVDFGDFLEKTNLPDLKKYRKTQNFKKFKIKSGNLIWGDFEMIFPLEDLYRGELMKGSVKAKRTA
jgi:hypothetical protein